MANLFCETLLRYREQKRYLLHEFVVMPNHFHLLLTIPSGATLERALQCIKGGFSHEAHSRLGLRCAIWQTSFLDHRVRDATEYARFRNYILQNPVRAGLVAQCSDYVHSSINSTYGRDEIPQWLKPESDNAALMQA
jgi:putative transposase